MLNYEGSVAECTGDNIFIVADGKLLTPSVDSGILEGITRATVIELAAEEGIELREVSLRLEDVYQAHECFLTGTAAEIAPVTKVDDRIIGRGKPGPITLRLTDLFHQKVGS
jgi:branched-chain amino acid aminotransferase